MLLGNIWKLKLEKSIGSKSKSIFENQHIVNKIPLQFGQETLVQALKS